MLWQRHTDGASHVGSTVTFSRAEHKVPHDIGPVYPFFINEAAYYEGNVAMILARRREVPYQIYDVTPSTPTANTKAARL